MGQAAPRYNPIERQVARILERFPGLRSSISAVYKRLVFLAKQEKGFTDWTHPQAILMTPHEWAGLEECQGQLFFGYYDKSPWSSDVNRALFHYHDGRQLSVIMLDKEENRAQNIGFTPAWNWQQGAMAQWVGQGTDQKVVYNTVENQILGCRQVSPDDSHGNFIPWPVQTIHPTGERALSLNYTRLMELRPDYGYAVEVKNFQPDQGGDKDGVFVVDLKSGKGELIYSLNHLASLVPPDLEISDARHKVNHCIYSPTGARFAFLHRLVSPKGKHSLLYVGTDNGSDLRFLMGSRLVSHYHWKDDTHLLAYARSGQGDRYYLINVETGNIECVGQDILDAYGDGHCTFSRDGRWILTDTYPDKARQQRLFLFDNDAGDLLEVGRFFSPWEFLGTARCDLHPRLSPDNQWISFDSAHTGQRKSFFLQISKIVEQ